MKITSKQLRRLIQESIRESWIHSGRAQKDELLLGQTAGTHLGHQRDLF